MTTTSPSWHEAWPTDFPDLEAVYRQTVPAQFPDLYDDLDSDEAKDIDATAKVLSWVAQGSQWIRGRLFPQKDTTAIFLDLWETALGILAKGTIALRQRAVIRSFRYSLGTGTEAAVRAIFAPIFGDEDNPAAVEFASPSAAEIAACVTTEEGWAMATTSLHIYHAAQTTAPDRPSAVDAMEQTKPAHETWSAGQYKTLKWDTEGGWDTACWGA